MWHDKNKWLTVALVNLAIVAFLGVVLRSKILFPIPGIDFKYLLHAHSHYAFGGWITLCLLTLMTYEILPTKYSGRKVYKWLLTGIFVCAAGMLFSFPFQGYAFFSILFSTLFIFVTYGFSWFFISHLIHSGQSKTVTLLGIVSLTSLVVSSAGPFTLAFVIASHSTNTMLYRDAIYTYLHFQYNGFFTLAIFALLFNYSRKAISNKADISAYRFSVILSSSVLPTLFLSYLWHFENVFIRSVAIVGCILLAATFIRFVVLIRQFGVYFENSNRFAKRIGVLSLIAFAIKTAVQVGIVFPAIGNEVFGDRPIIIGYLHLVMLGFVTLFLLAYLVQTGYFGASERAVKRGIIVFTSAVIANEVILMTQGLSAMLMMGSAIYPWLLLGAAIGLFTGAIMIAGATLRNSGHKAVHRDAVISNRPKITLKQQNYTHELHRTN